MSKIEDEIREAIWIILSTAKGERVMHPDFGCGIHDLVFRTVDLETLKLAEIAVREALMNNEPRIEVVNVSVSAEGQEGRLLISIDYRVRQTDNIFRIVWSFCLGEGQ